jgi:TPR repeat protein
MKRKSVYLIATLTMAASLPCVTAQAQQMSSGLGIASESSVKDSATPGKYYFDLGVDAIKKHDYRHAIAMYKVAASWGYKPAEYNLGVIFAKGEGDVPVDLPQGLAWMTLASERNDATYVKAQKRVQAICTPDQVAQSKQMLAVMNDTYGDEHALPRAKARWVQVRNEATGSHLGFAGANLQVSNGLDIPQGTLPQPGNKKKGNSGGTFYASAGMAAGANSTDGAVAYRELRETDNPYSPDFGTVIVGQPKTANGKDIKAAPDSKQSKPAQQF